MTIPPVPPRTWARFCIEASASPALTTKVDRYRVESVRTVRGAPLVGVAPGVKFVRLESMLELPAGAGDLVGVTQQLMYTRAAERPDLVTSSPPGLDAVCVVIPLTKSEAWWQLALDEREAMFRGATRAGHVGVGLGYARTVVRKLYHSRALPGAGWDFVTYFEFALAQREQFEALLAGMRDPGTNPEWNYVERESEIWLSRIGTLVS
jgi:Chlorite dismutase